MMRLPLVGGGAVYGWERLVLLRHLLDEGLPKTVIAERLAKLGVDALGNSPAEFKEIIGAEASVYRDVVKAAGQRIE